MRKSIAPLMVIGLGAAWYSMNDRKTKKKVHHLFEPIMDAEKKANECTHVEENKEKK